MGGRKSDEQFPRNLERKPGMDSPPPRPVPRPGARQSEFAVSEHGMNQESDQAKHNRPAKGADKH
jgi:hypothetical protein